MCKHYVSYTQRYMPSTLFKPIKQKVLSSSPLFPVPLSQCSCKCVYGCERLCVICCFEFVRNTRVCSVRERVYASLMPSVHLTPARPNWITRFFHTPFRGVYFFLHQFNVCAVFNGIFFVCGASSFYSIFVMFFLDFALCHCMFTLCQFFLSSNFESIAKVIFLV